MTNTHINDDLAAIMIGTPSALNQKRNSPDFAGLRRTPRDYEYQTELSCPMSPASHFSRDAPSASYYNFTGVDVPARLVGSLTEKRVVGPKVTSGLEIQKIVQ